MKTASILICCAFVLLCAGCAKKAGSAPQFNSSVVLKISVMKSGQVNANGSTVSLQGLEALLQANARDNGVVWYYREAATGAPPPQAMEVIKLVVKYKRPISMSSKPDFSDTIDQNGNSVPRKQ